jgi:plasmid stabilization system protein ParE
VSAAQVEITPEALREIEDAFEWYLERSFQAAEAFVHHVDNGLALSRALPVSGLTLRRARGDTCSAISPTTSSIVRSQVASKWWPSRITRGDPNTGAGAYAIRIFSEPPDARRSAGAVQLGLEPEEDN